MKNISSFMIFIVFILLGIVAFLLSFFLSGFEFFSKYSDLTFFIILIICACIYGVILKLFMK